MFFERDIDDIIAEQKNIKARLIWKQSSSQVFVIEPTQVISNIHNSLVFQVRHSPTKFSMVLRDSSVRPSQILRRYDTCPNHHNPDGEKLPPGHKHKWTDGFEDRFAYMPNPPIEPPTCREEIDRAVIAFLEECNIVLTDGADGYPKPGSYVQHTLKDYLYSNVEEQGEEETDYGV